MPNKKDVKQTNQSRIDNTKDAMNAGNGFKSGISSGTHGAGDTLRNK
ncbi:MAG: hypothetical protein AB9856_17140 [Cellulosilyticaceae bacterium]